MKLIAHRGNIQGKTHRENMPEYIEEALTAGYDVEIDVWNVLGVYYLGHDNPEYKISESFLEKEGLWCHAKNSQALSSMLKNPKIHCFWHDRDDYTLTSKGKIWIYPDKEPLEGGILVLRNDQEIPDDSDLEGVCSDFVGNLK